MAAVKILRIYTYSVEHILKVVFFQLAVMFQLHVFRLMLDLECEISYEYKTCSNEEGKS